jgi:putative copper export protein
VDRAIAVTAVARVLLYGGTMVAVGLALTIARLAEHQLRDARALRPVAWLGALALLMAPALLLLMQQQALELPWAEVLPLFTGTQWGRGWAQLAVASLCTALLLLPRMARLRWRLLLVSSLALCATMGGLGHAAASEQWPIGARVLDAVHAMAMSAWIGGLLITWISTRDSGTEQRNTSWRAFSSVATVMAPLTVLTGIASAVRMLWPAPWSVLVANDYARVLGVKTLLVLVVLGLGALQRRRITRRERVAGNPLRLELTLAMVVLIVTSVLTGSEPPP